MSTLLPPIDELQNLGDALNETDVALLNLAAAQGLPGTDIDVDACLDKLDRWARQVKFEILRHLYRFDPEQAGEPDEFRYGNSLARFFCWYLLQTLQEECGVRYNPERKFDPNIEDPRDIFIHGIVADDGEGGTCSSMPTVYVSVARRLGFPVYLVHTKEHGFFRWDDPKGTLITWTDPDFSVWIPRDRFNVEGAGEGIAYYPDSHYIQWPHLLTAWDLECGACLNSRTQAEDLAQFLAERAECYHALGDYAETLKALHYARQLNPKDKRYEALHEQRTLEVKQREWSIAESIRFEQEKQRGRPDHALNCNCAKCREIRQSKLTVEPPHNGSCQCKQCRDARAAMAQPAGFPQHGPSCRCARCSAARPAVADPFQRPSLGLPRPTALPANPNPHAPHRVGIPHASR